MLRQLGPRRPPASFQIRKKGKDSKKPTRWPIRTPLDHANASPPRSRTADLPSSGWPISASLEDSGPALERVANLRLARGQRTCPRAGGQSPPRSRTADLPSSGWPISASLEAVSRHKGQTAPPPNRPPYEGIKSQPLCHGSKDGRRQTATPAVDMTGVPSTDPGHRSATPVAVATLWSIQYGTRQVGAAPRYCSADSHHPDHLPLGKGSGDVTCPSKKSTLHARAGPRTSLLWGPGLPRAPGPSSVHARTPTGGSGTVPCHYYHPDTGGRPPPSPRDQGRNPG